MEYKPRIRDGADEVHIDAGDALLEGNLVIPPAAQGLVLFVHSSGSSRNSPRNRYVASSLRQCGLATLLLDLLTAEEEREDWYSGHLRFDIGLLARRVASVTDWLVDSPQTAGLRIGYFGASTGGGAALVAATMRPDDVDAVVSRGGRADMAGPALPYVEAPTLLIVGGQDLPLLELNRVALAQLRGESRLTIVPGATHLFEEQGALAEVASLAQDWFCDHLRAPLRERAAG
jgi:putative phosphoribosyl transferase